MILYLFLIPIIGLFVWSFCAQFHRAGSFSGEIVLFGSRWSLAVRLLTLSCLNLSLGYAGYLWKSFPIYNDEDLSIYYPSNSFLEVYHNTNLPSILLSLLILVLSYLATWYTDVNIMLLSFLFLLLDLCLVGAFSRTTVIAFLFFFEVSALPIFILVVYCGSARRERLKAAYYFIIFTVYGSLSLLLFVLNCYNSVHLSTLLADGSSSFKVSWILLSIAFAVKIPLFPFHIWLPYAHVEASTAVSMILAALLLKLGGYGLIKYLFPYYSLEVQVYFQPAVLILCLLGVVYGALSALRQVDLKRQVAFSSVSHMSFAVLGLFTYTEAGIKGGIYLMLSHGLTSALLFFLVGTLSDRYHTRSNLAYGGLLGPMPIFSGFYIFASIANAGFPGTSGFVPEFLVLLGVSSFSTILIPFVLLGMLVSTGSTLIFLLRMFFGHTKGLYFGANFVDMTKLEIFICAMLSGWVILLGLHDIFL